MKVTRRSAALSVALLLLAGYAVSGLAGAASTPRQAGVTPSTVRATNRDNGRTITLRRGQRLRVILSSTYWQLQASSKPAVLRLLGPPQKRPQQSGCAPGSGCGTATATYVAAAAGHAIVTATRTSCGEAMGCTAASSRFSLNVAVH